MDNIQAQIDLFLSKDKRNEESYLRLAQLAAVPLLLSPDLLYKLWRNFKSYTNSEGKNSSIPHLVVSDLLLSNFCRPVGYQLYKLEEEVRLRLLKGLSKPQKDEIATFLEQYAIKSFSPAEKNIQNIHLKLAKSYLRQEEFINEIKADLLDKDKKSLEKSHLLNLYYQLEAQADDSNGLGLTLRVVNETDEAENILKIERRFLRGKIGDRVGENEKVSKFLTKIPHYEIATQDRIEDVEQIKSLLKTNNKIFVQGKQGTGKTSLLIQFIKRYEADYEHIISLKSHELNQIQTFLGIIKNLNIEININSYQERLNFIYQALGAKKSLIIIDEFDKRGNDNILIKFLDESSSNIDYLLAGQRIPEGFYKSFLEYSIDYNEEFKPELIKYLEKDLRKIAKRVQTPEILDKNELKDDFLYYVDEEGKVTHLLLWNLVQPNLRHLSSFTDLIKFEINKSKGLNLRHIENLVNLQELCLCEDDISDINFVKKLINLQELCLCANKILDISNLENLTNLANLKIFANQISDISSLKDLTKLKVLDISGNKISNMKLLGELHNLEELDIAANEIVDILFIQNLSKLRILDISGNEIFDISVITSLQNLEQLDLAHCAISQFSEDTLLYFSNQKNLRELVLNGNYIRGVPHGILEAENALEGLRAFMHNSKAISNLEKQLYFELKQTQDETSIIAPNLRATGFYMLNESREVTHLNLLGFELKDLSFLSSFEWIAFLNLSANRISNIEPLSKLVNLLSLDLSDNRIDSVLSLGSLDNLNNLFLDNNEIKSIEQLPSLENLEELHLQNNKISSIDESIFDKFPKLIAIYLQGNPIENIPVEILPGANCLDNLRIFLDEKKEVDIAFSTPEKALAFFKSNPNTTRKDEITDLLLSDTDFLKKVMDIHLSEAISNDFAIADGHSFSLKKITNFKWFSDNNSITFAGEGITSILLENTKNNKIEKAFDEETTFSGELYYNEEYNDWEFEGLFEFPNFNLPEDFFTTPQEALAFFIENPNTSRKDEIIEAIKDDNYFLANILEQILHDELHSEITLGNHEIDETIIDDITMLEYIISDDEIAIAGSGTTSVLIRFDDNKIHDDFSFTFDIRIEQDTKKQWVLAHNEQNIVNVTKQEDENTPNDKPAYDNEEPRLDKASIKQLIAEYRIKEAIDALSKVLPMHEQNNILSLAAHWNSLEHLSNIGFLDSEDDIARNKIIHELLSLCDSLDAS